MTDNMYLIKIINMYFQFAKILEGEPISGQSGQPRINGLHTAYLDRQITLFAPIDRAVRQWKSEKELVNKYHRVSCLF